MLSCREAFSDSHFHLFQLSPTCSPAWASLHSSKCHGVMALFCCLSGLRFYLHPFFSAFQSSLMCFLYPFWLRIRSACVSKCWDIICCAVAQSPIVSGRQESRLLEKSGRVGIFPLELMVTENQTLQVLRVWISTALGGFTVLLRGQARLYFWRNSKQTHTWYNVYVWKSLCLCATGKNIDL